MSYELHREDDPSGLTLIVEADPDPLDPRAEYDHLGQMVCWHERYRLGDRHDWTDPDAFRQHLEAQKNAVVLPLFLFDHSGLAIATDPFHCPWDSGQIGWIWMPGDKALRAFGAGRRRLTSDVRIHAEAALRSEVREYHQYLSNDVWCVRVVDEDGETLDSCGGFFGSDYAIEEGRSMLAALVPEHVQRKAEEFAARLEEERPDLVPGWTGEAVR